MEAINLLRTNVTMNLERLSALTRPSVDAEQANDPELNPQPAPAEHGNQENSTIEIKHKSYDRKNPIGCQYSAQPPKSASEAKPNRAHDEADGHHVAYHVA